MLQDSGPSDKHTGGQETNKKQITKIKIRSAHSVGKVEISSFDHNGSVVHRVRMGPITEVADADSMLENVIKLGYNGARIILE